MEFSDELSIFVLENLEREDYSNKAFLKEFRTLLTTGNSLGNLFKEIKPVKLNKSLGLYTGKEVLFDIENIQKEVEFYKDTRRISREFNKFFNFLVFMTILHEFRHAYHGQLCFDFKDTSLIAALCRVSYTTFAGALYQDFSKVTKNSSKTGKILYDKFYNYFPIERDAEMFSFGYMLQLWRDYLQDENIEDLNTLYYELMKTGYEFKKDKTTCPLNVFYKAIKSMNTFDNFDFSEYDINTRLSFGMPITKSEFIEERARILGH